MILVSGEGSLGGKHFETGAAYVLGKDIDIIGSKEHIFHELSKIVKYKNWDEWFHLNVKYKHYVK